MTYLAHRHLALLIAVFCLAFIGGCARPLQTGPLPEGISITPLAGLRGEGPVAWHPSGSILATGSDGLTLLNLTDGRVTTLDATNPANLVWSPDGTRLAIAWPQGEATRLELKDNAGTKLTEIVLPGLPDRLLWSTESGLLIITSQLKLYSFGGDLTMLLHRWDGQTTPATVTLHNSTIKPNTAKSWQQGLIPGSLAVLSPSGEELLYLRLHDPPAFTGSYRLTLHHLESGAEKQIASLPLTIRAAQFIDDEIILVDDGNTAATELFLWSKTRADTWPYAGGPLEISPGGRYWLIGDQLLRDGSEIIRIHDLEQALFSPDGSSLLLQSGGHWHILQGLIDVKQPAISAADLKKIRQLRNWRSRGLISPEEFRHQQQRMSQP